MLQLATNPAVPSASPVLGVDIDALGALRARIADLEREEKILAGSIKARLIARGSLSDNGPAAHGDQFAAGLNIAERVSLDQPAAIALLEQHGLDVPRKSTVVETLRVVRLA